MKFNRKLGLLAAAVAAVGAGAAVEAANTSAATTNAAPTTSSTATPGPGSKLWRHHRGGILVGMMLHATRQLDLTPEQQTAIKGILSSARSERQAAAASNAPDLSILANPGDPNYAAALQAARSMAEARFQRQVELQSQIYNVLSADQKAKLPAVLASMKAQFQQRRAAWMQQHAADTAGSAGSN